MPTLIIEENGFYSCDGSGKCGGTSFRNLESLKSCFNCELCNSFQRDKKIKIKGMELSLNEFVSKSH